MLTRARDKDTFIFQITLVQEPTEFRKQPIRTRYLGHVTGYQPIRDQYFLIWSVPALVF